MSASTLLLVNAIGLVAALALVYWWLRHESRTSVRVMPAATFGSDRRLRAVYVTMAALVIASTVEVFAPYFGQHLQGLQPLEAGCVGAAMAAGWTAGSLALSGATARRALVIRMAPLFSVAGLEVLAFVGPVRSGALWIVIAVVVGLVLLGWGVGMAWPHLLTSVLQLSGGEDQERAGASVTIVQLTATAFGSALAGMVVNATGFGDPGHTASAARWLFVSFILAAVVASIAAWRAGPYATTAVRTRNS
ncbi:hypothetical protein [Rhodococcus sp. ACT016]|uniref:hypothetical protein n=1 Tax=Rhodococcus sp. ACT016 TaxID=3134808 RepID=UPI003D2E1091